MPTTGWIPKLEVVADGTAGCCGGLLGSGGIGDDLTIVTGAGVIVVLLVVCCSISPAPKLLAGKVGSACVVVIGRAVVAAIVMAAKPVSSPVACCLLSGEDGCDGTDNGTSENPSLVTAGCEGGAVTGRVPISGSCTLEGAAPAGLLGILCR